MACVPLHERWSALLLESLCLHAQQILNRLPYNRPHTRASASSTPRIRIQNSYTRGLPRGSAVLPPQLQSPSPEQRPLTLQRAVQENHLVSVVRCARARARFAFATPVSHCRSLAVRGGGCTGGERVTPLQRPRPLCSSSPGSPGQSL